MGGLNFRDAYEFDPETYGDEGGAPLGRLEAMMQQGQRQPDAASGSPPNGGAEYDPRYYGSPQGVLLGRLLVLQAEQNRDQSIPEGRPSSLPSGPNFRRLARIPNGTPLPMSGPAAPYAAGSAPPPAIQRNEADQAQ
jgi:hypothetical protein